MSKRVEILNKIYNGIDEDTRLSRSRHGQLEYITTMNYIRRFAKKGDKILEMGAGTGRYSIALAKAGYEVTAVELVENNLKTLKSNGKALDNMQAFQGDALDLGRFADGTFDITLVFGPLYHLYDEKDVHRALDEAIRVTKNDGVILVAFLSVYAILFDYLNGQLFHGIEENFTSDYHVKHFEEQCFTGYDVAEFEALFQEKNVAPIALAAADTMLQQAEMRSDFRMTDEEFDLFAKYHLATCEKRELLGSSSHLLYICKKKK